MHGRSERSASPGSARDALEDISNVVSSSQQDLLPGSSQEGHSPGVPAAKRASRSPSAYMHGGAFSHSGATAERCCFRKEEHQDFNGRAGGGGGQAVVAGKRQGHGSRASYWKQKRDVDILRQRYAVWNYPESFLPLGGEYGIGVDQVGCGEGMRLGVAAEVGRYQGGGSGEGKLHLEQGRCSLPVRMMNACVVYLSG